MLRRVESKYDFSLEGLAALSVSAPDRGSSEPAEAALFERRLEALSPSQGPARWDPHPGLPDSAWRACVDIRPSVSPRALGLAGAIVPQRPLVLVSGGPVGGVGRSTILYWLASWFAQAGRNAGLRLRLRCFDGAGAIVSRVLPDGPGSAVLNLNQYADGIRIGQAGTVTVAAGDMPTGSGRTRRVVGGFQAELFDLGGLVMASLDASGISDIFDFQPQVLVLSRAEVHDVRRCLDYLHTWVDRGTAPEQLILLLVGPGGRRVPAWQTALADALRPARLLSFPWCRPASRLSLRIRLDVRRVEHCVDQLGTEILDHYLQSLHDLPAPVWPVS